MKNIFASLGLVSITLLSGCAGLDMPRLQQTAASTMNGTVNNSIVASGGTTECVASGITAGIGELLVDRFSKKSVSSYYSNSGQMEYQNCLQQQRFARMQAEQMRQQMAWREAEERRRMAPKCRYQMRESASGGVVAPRQESRDCQAESYEEFRGRMTLR